MNEILDRRLYVDEFYLATVTGQSVLDSLRSLRALTAGDLLTNDPEGRPYLTLRLLIEAGFRASGSDANSLRTLCALIAPKQPVLAHSDLIEGHKGATSALLRASLDSIEGWERDLVIPVQHMQATVLHDGDCCLAETLPDTIRRVLLDHASDVDRELQTQWGRHPGAEMPFVFCESESRARRDC